MDAVSPGSGSPASIPVTAAGVSSGTEQETSIDGAAYEEAAGRVRGPMDEPGGSFTFAHGAQVAPFSIAVFRLRRVVRGPRGTGDGPRRPIVMSVTTFAGSAQFAAVSILGDGGTVGAAVVAAILLNLRYGPIGVSVAPALAGPWWSRLLRAQLVVDETWALSADGRGGHDAKIIVGAGVVLYAAWVVGTVVGVLFGDLIGDPRDGPRRGLSRAVPRIVGAEPGSTSREAGGDPRRGDRPGAHADRAAGVPIAADPPA